MKVGTGLLSLGLGVFAFVGALLLSAPLISYLVIVANHSFAEAIVLREGGDPERLTRFETSEFTYIVAAAGALILLGTLAALGCLVGSAVRGQTRERAGGLPGPGGNPFSAG